jgi:hypothetical protein
MDLHPQRVLVPGVVCTLLAMRASGRVVDVVQRESPWVSLKQGLRFVFSTPIMVWTMALDFIATFFSGANSLLPIFADQVLKVGAFGFGWVRAAPALGALVGSIYTSLKPIPARQGRVLLWAVGAYGRGHGGVRLFAELLADVSRTRRDRPLRISCPPSCVRSSANSSHRTPCEAV